MPRDILFGQAAGDGDPDVLAPEEHRPPRMRQPKDRQLPQAQRQFPTLEQKGVVGHELPGHGGMTRQHPEDVEVHRVASIARTGPRYIVTRYAEQRTDCGVLVVAPLIRSQRGQKRHVCRSVQTVQFGQRMDLFQVVLERVVDETREDRRRAGRGHRLERLLGRLGFPTGSSGLFGRQHHLETGGTSRALSHSAAVSTDTPNGHQPSASVSARRSERLVRPPTQIGICGCSAHGSTVRPPNE